MRMVAVRMKRKKKREWKRLKGEVEVDAAVELSINFTVGESLGIRGYDSSNYSKQYSTRIAGIQHYSVDQLIPIKVKK